MPRSSLNLTSSGPIENGRRQPNKTLRHRKSIAIIAQKASPGRKSQDRLTGGADKSVTEEAFESIDTTDVIDAPSQVTVINAADNEEVSNNDPKTEPITPPGGPCCFCVSKIPTSTGNKKLDEMFDCVQLNLQEAGRALATLSENFEHDFKLLLIDILARMQQWTGVGQTKLDACKNETDLLRKELMSRLCEVNNKEAELLSKEQDIMKKEQEVAALKGLLRERSGISNQEGRFSELEGYDAGSQTFEGKEEGELSISKSKMKIEDPDAFSASMRGASATTEGFYEGHGSRLLEGGVSIMQKPSKTLSGRSIPKRSTDYDRSTTGSKGGASVRTGREAFDQRKEAELEAEILRLRQENDRIMKERSDYENAIQRALLRGVSSLNVETLKVLRAPSIYCAPCAPSSAPSENRTEPVVLCKTAKASSAGRKLKVCKRGDYEKSSLEEPSEEGAKSLCGSPCCKARKSRKCTSNSLLFLLHQADPVSACVKNHENRTVTSICQGSRKSDGTSGSIFRKQ